MNTNKLRGLIVEKGYSQADVAEKIGITPKTFYDKMKKQVFLSSEIDTMIAILDITDPAITSEIFFNNNVTQIVTRKE